MNQTARNEELYISESEKALGTHKISRLFIHYAVPGVMKEHFGVMGDLGDVSLLPFT